MIKTPERNIRDKRLMKTMMTPEEAYDKGLYQVARILDRDRKARQSLGMKTLHESVNTVNKRGRPKI